MSTKISTKKKNATITKKYTKGKKLLKIKKIKEKKLTKKQLKELEIKENEIRLGVLSKELPKPYYRKINALVTKNQKTGFINKEVVSNLIEEFELDKKAFKITKEILSLREIDLLESKKLLGTNNSKKPTDIINNTNNSVQLYLKDIGRYLLLTKKDEQELAKKIKLAKYVLNGQKKVLNTSQRNKIIAEGSAARDKMACSNLRLVVSIAKNYSSRSRDLSLLDLIQEGTVGLYKAVDGFDADKGTKFSTYATWWIKQTIRRSLADNSRTIRVPVHMSETIARYKKIITQLEQELNRPPKTQEIAFEMNLSIDKINMIKQVGHDVVQLDKVINIGDDDSTTIGDVLPDKNQESPDTLTSKLLLKEHIDTLLEGLTKKEKDIIEMRHGIDDNRGQLTLEQIGRKFNVTRERVRQIEANAIKKLRENREIERLKNY